MTQTTTSPPASHHAPPERLIQRYCDVRSFTRELVGPLSPEDMQVQSMEDASPTKWHLAHTSWFFETFLLTPFLEDWKSPNKEYAFLYNSYYNAIGEQYSRPDRGKISRPSLDEVLRYREGVDEAMLRLLEGIKPGQVDEIDKLLTLGLNHEQQHQELMLTDLKHAFSMNPLNPRHEGALAGPDRGTSKDLRWLDYGEEIVEIGHRGEGFCFDNEEPLHRVLLLPYQISSRLVTCGEYLQFMQDAGYERPDLWLSEGWSLSRELGWQSPLYWRQDEGGWKVFTTAGLKKLVPDEPVCHVSYFEAEAFARWSDSRLPTEFEWEHSARPLEIEGNLAAKRHWHPVPLARDEGDRPSQMYGDVWEWTSSSYAPYPGYRPAPGAVGEYNGKFMCNQYVLRGGSCATSQDHIRSTYRNFFPARARWQFSGIRLARSL